MEMCCQKNTDTDILKCSGPVAPFLKDPIDLLIESSSDMS